MHIIAHRGFSGRYPEMSPLAYEKALELPIAGVECDIRLSRDGHIVCVHDRDLLRLSGRRTVISSATLQEIKDTHPGVLTLDELIEMVFSYPGKHLYIEPKHPTRAGRLVEHQLASCLRHHKLLTDERIHVISFSHSMVRRMAALAPQIETFYLRRHWEHNLNPTDIFFSRPHGAGMSIARAKLSPELIGAKAKPTYIYTVNDPQDMRYCRDRGVKVMATDFPDIALDVLG
ncbi:glycerophosphodiester phosphodiesterase family protein [Corynebacterium sp. sy039]|uniref:glycerophosphodiester phosphodiesterase family protein n=1 Tax=Corynebacterium sp. sy039 TaxID=2599641 RepID=UPI0011B606AD|nr:glycerophosphodiester phosphodiesterase family protein [Corynebacterium sp. sy039]QDZ43376.1 glycerophosphodiester phosphodiesterase [Corynebacterium sp. sy039]